jgi:hypothetical protein
MSLLLGRQHTITFDLSFFADARIDSSSEVVQQVWSRHHHFHLVSLTPSLGCVVAGRLAYADPNLQVMLIEGMCLRSRAISQLTSAP